MTTVTAMYLIMRSERNPAVFPLDKWEDNSELEPTNKSPNMVEVFLGVLWHPESTPTVCMSLKLIITAAIKPNQ